MRLGPISYNWPFYIDIICSYILPLVCQIVCKDMVIVCLWWAVRLECIQHSEAHYNSNGETDNMAQPRFMVMMTFGDLDVFQNCIAINFFVKKVKVLFLLCHRD